MNRRERREAARGAYRGQGLKGTDKAKAVSDLARSLPGGAPAQELAGYVDRKLEQPKQRTLVETESGLIVPADADV